MEYGTVVMYPTPAIGHLVPMEEFAKLICTHHPSLSIIILMNSVPYETGSTDKYIATVTTTMPTLKFLHLGTINLPQNLISADFSLDAAFRIPELYNPIVHKTLVSIAEKSTIKAVILDMFSNASIHISKTSLNLPTYYFYVTGASRMCELLYFPTTHNTNANKIEDSNDWLHIPGVPPIHFSDIPNVGFDRESKAYRCFLDTAINMAKSSGIIINTYAGLEERAVEALRSGKCVLDGPTPPVYLIGPLVANVNQEDHNQNECIKWLNSQPSKSVVFLCFGSMGVFKKDQLKEIAIGLEQSGQRFLWVVRNPPLDDESELSSSDKEVTVDDILPQEFLERTKDKGMVVKKWVSQPAILNHDSVGGLVYHCGWNSTLEALVAGVPMVGWPLYADQAMNKVYLVEEMKVALAMKMSSDGFVTAEVVKEALRELKEGMKLKERVFEMSRRAKAAIDDGGSSRLDFSKLTKPWTTI